MADILYLIEPCDRVPNMLSVVDWFFALLWESELAGRHAVFPLSADARRVIRNPAPRARAL